MKFSTLRAPGQEAGDVGQPMCLMHEEGRISKALAGAVSTAHHRQSQTFKGGRLPLGPQGKGKGEVP